MTDRGTSNSNARGPAASRRARRAWIIEIYGTDGIVLCFRCELAMLPEEFEVDRIVPGCRGGTYRRSNIRPICPPCNKELGNATRDGIMI